MCRDFIMNPKRTDRDDLLDDAHFWALMYEYWVQARVGDKFKEGYRYFFSISEKEMKAFFHDLERTPVPDGHYPELCVLLPLRNRWRVGVVLSLYPEDFNVEDVVAPRASGEHVVFGVNGGHPWLPALRWDEILSLRDSVEPQEPLMRARIVLLMFPCVCLSSAPNVDAVRQVLLKAWENSGIPIRYADELVERPIEDHSGTRQQTKWRNHPTYGWINDSQSSLRDPKVKGAHTVLPVMKEFFQGLE